MAEQRAQWGSRLGFIIAAAGSAVGLGNIWKFPYITGENGGGLFVLIYLVCIALVGIPIMMAEIMIGRAAQRQPVAAFHALQGKGTRWAAVGWLGIVAGFIILSYYVVVAGWAMDYTLKSVVNFSAPIHAQAELEATEYLAKTDLGTMRDQLIQRRVERRSRDRTEQIRMQAPPSVWRGFDRFQTALERVEGSEEARQRLLTDPVLRRQVEEAEALQTRIQQTMMQELEAARAEYDAAPAEQILAETEAITRRSITFEKMQGVFLALASDGWTSLLWAGLFSLITISIVSRGISGGIERACWILMPVLFGIVLIMVIYGAFKPGFQEAVSFVFKPNPSKLKASGVLEALGHAFFTLSLGMGAMITYGSYQRTKRELLGQSVTIALLDTLLALLACLMIFPIIFSYDQEPAAGPGLVFMSMPLAFAEIGRGGMMLSILFFGLLVFAALTSAISLLEVVASYFIDERGWPRHRAAWGLGGFVFLCSVPSAFSLDPQFLMSGWEPSFGVNFFDTMDYLASNWMLPLGGLLISIYVGWVMPRRLQQAEVEDMPRILFRGWLLLVQVIAPALVIVVLLQKVGVLDADELFHDLLSRLPYFQSSSS